MALVRLQCPACGAQLPPQELDATITCRYCDSRFEAADARSAKTMAGVDLDRAALLEHVREAREQLSEVQAEIEELRDEREALESEFESESESESTSRSGPSGPTLLGRVLSAALKLVIIAVIVGVVLLVLISQGLLALDDVPVLRDLPQLRALVEDVVDDRYDPQGGPPVLVEIDGEPAAIVRLRRSGSELLFVAALALPSGETLWQRGPIVLGNDDDKDLARVRFASVGPFVLFSDGNGRIHVHDLQTGNLLRGIDVDRPVESLCVPLDAEREDSPQIHVLRADDRHRLLDPAAGELTRTRGAPAGCEDHQRAAGDASLVDPERVRDRLDDFEVDRVHLAGKKAVAVGHSDAGQPVVVAIAHQGGPKSRVVLREPLWTTAATGELGPEAAAPGQNRVSAIAGERVILDWRGRDDAVHLSSVSLVDGALVWDVTLTPGGAAPMLVGDDELLLVARDAHVEVRDASTGERLGALTPGDE